MSPPSQDASLHRMDAIIEAIDVLLAEFDEIQRSLHEPDGDPGRVGAAVPPPRTLTLAHRVHDIIRSDPRKWTSLDLVPRTQAGRAQINVALSQLHRQGRLCRVARGVYVRAEPSDRAARDPTPTVPPPVLASQSVQRDTAPKTVHRRNQRSPVPTHTDTSPIYLTNASTRTLPWEEQLAAFRQLPALRINCWRAIFESQRFSPLVLDHLAKTSGTTLPDAWSANATFLRRRHAICKKVAAWCVEVDPFGDVLHEVIQDFVALQRGKPCDWLPGRTMLSAQNHRWLERCSEALLVLDTLRGRIAVSNIGLGMRSARSRTGQGGMSFGDLTNEAFMGLLRAVDRFEPERGLKFSTYAVWWIRQSSNRAVQNKGRAIRIPVHVQQFLLDVRGAKNHVGNDPVALATRLGAPLWKVEKLLKYESTVFTTDTLDRPVNGRIDGSMTVGETIPSNDPSPLEEVELKDLKMEMHGVIACLPSFEAEVIRKRFGIDCVAQTLVQIGEDHFLSRERIRQIETRAMKLLRQILASPKKQRGDTTPVTRDGPFPRVLDVLRAYPRVLMPCSRISALIRLDIWVVRRACIELERNNMLHRVGKRFMWLPSEDEIEEGPVELASDMDANEQTVISFLENNHENTFSRASICRDIGLPAWTVRVALGLLARKNAIQQVGSRFGALPRADPAPSAAG